jgi:hypothetical protein
LRLGLVQELELALARMALGQGGNALNECWGIGLDAFFRGGGRGVVVFQGNHLDTRSIMKKHQGILVAAALALGGMAFVGCDNNDTSTNTRTRDTSTGTTTNEPTTRPSNTNTGSGTSSDRGTGANAPGSSTSGGTSPDRSTSGGNTSGAGTSGTNSDTQNPPKNPPQ